MLWHGCRLDMNSSQCTKVAPDGWFWLAIPFRNAWLLILFSILAISCNTPNKPVARTIMIRGWVQKPGEYTISGQFATLHDVIREAGGLSRSYPESEYRACFFLNGKRIRERTVIKPTLWDTPLKRLNVD